MIRTVRSPKLKPHLLMTLGGQFSGRHCRDEPHTNLPPAPAATPTFRSTRSSHQRPPQNGTQYNIEFGMSLLGIASKRCAVCPVRTGLLPCDCKVVSYCGPGHRSADRSKHKTHCTTIKNTRETLAREEAKLRDGTVGIVMPADIFNTGVGNFWALYGTQAYMRARFAAADALLYVATVSALEEALEHYTDMLRLCRHDNLGVRHMIPPLLLRLGREQECYDFLKWSATVDDENRANDVYSWCGPDLPYVDLTGADLFEPLGWSCESLSHLVTLTLLKLRLFLDLQAYEPEFGFELGDITEPDRPIGKFVKSKVRSFSTTKISTTIEVLEGQYHQLCQRVNAANPYFWDALLDESGGPLVIPKDCTPGSPEEAQRTLYHCKEAWSESEDALVMVESDTCQYVRPYEAPTTTVGSRVTGSEQRPGDLERRRGFGRDFPSKFEHELPTSSPPSCFPATRMNGSQGLRFVSQSDPKSLLLYIDGACVNNGQPNPRGGWAVVYGASDTVSGRLEEKGPFGDDSVATSNRAELRAAIAALRLHDWVQDGFESMVIATDSSYVVDGATGWAKGWFLNGWKTQSGRDVKNRDLWELLLGEVERLAARGFRVHLWNISRGLNAAADKLAKAAANMARAEPQFRDVVVGASQSRARASGRRILALCLDYEDIFDAGFGSLIAQITSKATMERATTTEVALNMLNEEPPTSVILVTDGAVTRQRMLCERLIDRLRGGATVILMGCFSSGVTMGQFDRFFARLGLPWRRGSYRRQTVQLRRQVVGNQLATRLLTSYSQKALFVTNVDRAAVWYAEPNTTTEAAVVFANVGAGRLGYVGDVNGEEGSEAAVLAMCGLLDG